MTTDRAAQTSHRPIAVSLQITRAAKSLVSPSANVNGTPSLFDRWRVDTKRLARYTAEEIIRVAQQGNVLIQGWGAATLLRDIPQVISVRVCENFGGEPRYAAWLPHQCRGTACAAAGASFSRRS
jgi:hypothetical protein